MADGHLIPSAIWDFYSVSLIELKENFQYHGLVLHKYVTGQSDMQYKVCGMSYNNIRDARIMQNPF